MIYVTLPYYKPRRASFYLSMEEYIARNFNEDEYFFMWQVEPLALVGRNQLIDNEINIASIFCAEKVAEAVSMQI